MSLHASPRARLTALALVFAGLAAGCGDGGGLPAAPAPAPAAAPMPLMFGAFPSAVGVVGQESLDEVAPVGTPGTLNLPIGEPAVSADGRLFVVDGGAQRTLKVFGRYDRQGPSVDFPGVALPRSVSIQSGRMVVIDDQRVRIFESATPGAAELAFAGNTTACLASGLLGPTSAYLTSAGRLVVADSAHHRVLIWNQVTSGDLGDADVVVGQPTMTSCTANAAAPNPGAATLRSPGSVWSDGNRLVVADTGNHRVLVWDSLPTTDFQPAITVIGQTGFADAQSNAGGLTVPSAMSLSTPRAVDVSPAGQLAVADEQNDRVMVWDRLPAAGAHGQAANQVLGKNGFTDGQSAPVSAKTLAEPTGVRFHGTDLVVVDQENNRVVVWRGTAPPPPPAAPLPADPPPVLFIPYPSEPIQGGDGRGVE